MQQLHFGSYSPYWQTALEDTADILHSDTLYSAIINTSAGQLGNSDTENLIKHFDAGTLQISSGFWGLKGEKGVLYFYPKPVTCDFFSVNDGKRIKKIRFISEKILEQGITPEEWSNTAKCCIIQDNFVVLKSEWDQLELGDWRDFRIIDKQTNVKVQIARNDVKTNDSGPYAQTNLLVVDHSEKNIQTVLWFYARVDEAIKPHFDDCLLQIVGSGIGGERSTIHSAFKSCMDNKVNQKYDDSDSSISLGLILPTEEKVSGYGKYMIRGGRKTFGAERLKRVRMIAEGAVFNNPNPIGAIVEIGKTEDHRVLRYGKGMTLPINKVFLPNLNII